MPKRSKRYLENTKKLEEGKAYSLKEAIELVQQTANCKFDESVLVSVKLGVDPRHADQQVRGTVSLPHGTGKTKRVLVFTTGEKIKEAQDAGADVVGAEDLVQRVEGGFLEFDAAIATPDMMRIVGRLGKLLGPRGLMPSSKTGTVTFDVASAVREIKGGRVEYRVDKFAIVHNAVGKASFGPQKLFDNLKTFIQAISKARPSAAKGQYVRSLHLSASMGPGIKVDPAVALKEIVE